MIALENHIPLNFVALVALYGNDGTDACSLGIAHTFDILSWPPVIIVDANKTGNNIAPADFKLASVRRRTVNSEKIQSNILANVYVTFGLALSHQAISEATTARWCWLADFNQC